MHAQRIILSLPRERAHAMVQLNDKHIVLVNPPYERVSKAYSFVKHLSNRSPSLGLLHLAAEVRLHDYVPSILESDAMELDTDGVVEKILNIRPKYVGITLFTVGVFEGMKIARRVKDALPGVKIIVGGPHLSSMGVETIKRFPEFDIAVQGEGEKTLVKLLEALDTGGDLSKIPGLIYKENEKLRVTPPPVTPNELDELPFPAWDLLPGFPGAYPLAAYDYPRGPVGTIAASRGCPFHCKFCDTSTFGARVRYYTPKKVFEMMKHLNEKYGIKHIAFVDDLFLASRSRTTELCNLLLENNLKMTWSCDARVDTVKPDLLDLMKKAGCWQIAFGLETGSDEMLKRMDKSARVERSEQAVNWSAAAGIRVKGLFMLGYPGETKETIETTKAFVSRIPMTIMNLTKFTPYPGSPVYRELYGTSIRDDHWEKMNGMNFVWAPDGITVDELDKHYRDVLSTFYGQKRVHKHYMTLSIKHPKHFHRVLRFGIGLTLAKLKSVLSGRKGLLTSGTERNLDAGPSGTTATESTATGIIATETTATQAAPGSTTSMESPQAKVEASKSAAPRTVKIPVQV